jgi:DNA-binding IclR family transcriptional regulator
MAKADQRYVINSVSRALDLLKCFSRSDRELSLTEISRQLELSPSTVFRLLATLQAHGYLEQEPDGRKYRLGIACLELGSVYLSHSDIRQAALPILERLRDECGETIHLATLAGREVVYMERLDPLQPIGFMGSVVGGRAPAYCTALGKMLLSYRSDDEIRELYAGHEMTARTPRTIRSVDALIQELDGIRIDGYSMDNEENEEGVTCVAAAISDYRDIAMAAISVSGPTERIRDAIDRWDLLVKVKAAGHDISHCYGGLGRRL